MERTPDTRQPRLGLLTLASGIGLALAAGAAVWWDLRSRRIPNLLALATLVAGLGFRLPMGWESLGWGLLAATLAFGFGFVFYLLGGLGGGDVKLMAGLATFLEPEGLLIGLLVMAFTGGAMALVSVIRAGRVRQTLQNLRLFYLTAGRESFRGWKGESPMASLTSPDTAVITNPYAVAIAAGALAGWAAPLLGVTL